MTDNIETPAQPAAEAIEPEKVESASAPEAAPVSTPVEPVAAPVVDKAPEVEAPKPKPAVKPEPARHVVTNADKDPVLLSSCLYMNKFNKKSLTVHHLQRRLVELGFNDAVGDKDGWYGELTHKAVTEFQKANRLEATGITDAKTFAAIFDGDPNVEVVLD